MNEEVRESMIDLLTKKATVGLDADEQQRLGEYFRDAGIAEDISFDIAAAAIGLVDLQADEPMPAHLQARIIASADEFFASRPVGQHQVAAPVTPPSEDKEYQKVFTVEPRRSWSWLSWAVAALALVALGANIWLTRMQPPQVAGPPLDPPVTPEKLTPEQELAQMMASPEGMTKASWAPGNMTDLKNVGGDVVWSDKMQKGYMRLRGLPMNDKTKETYQLWIFDKTQDKATPIDGGTFDVDRNGDVVIPIDAKLRAQEPAMFAITVEKPGGVVVSKREKIAALAKVETQIRSNT